MKIHTKEELLKLSRSHSIIAFDGVCNLCNSYVNWLIKRDTRKVFRYTTLQSQSGIEIQTMANIDLDSVILIHQGAIYTLSDVALQVMKILGGVWLPLSWLRMIPKGVRDTIYLWIARNRYKWFGKKNECMIPDGDIRELFL